MGHGCFLVLPVYTNRTPKAEETSEGKTDFEYQ